MNYWLAIHDANSYNQHPTWIGKAGDNIPAEFTRLKTGDGIIYYCTGISAITGTFKVKSRARLIEDDDKWQGSYTIVELRPVNLAPPKKPVSMQDMLKELPKSFSLFPDRKLSGIKLKGRTLLPITKADFDMVSTYIRKGKTGESELFKGRSNDSGLGQPGKFGVMNYAPTSEQGVVALFVHYMNDLGFEKLEFIRAGFPDACAIERTGATYQRKFIEFEYRSSGFRQHVMNPKHKNIRCDYVVCWEDDYFGCPVEVIELKSKIAEAETENG